MFSRVRMLSWIIGITPLLVAPGLALAQSSVPDASEHAGKPVPDRAPDKVIDGDLSKGKAISLSWAQGSGTGCWTATEDINWNGNHVHHVDLYGPKMDLVFRVTPAPDVDVSLYALRVGEKDKNLPPEISRASCSVSYDKVKDKNPGVSEAVAMRAPNRYRVIIGVAGANGAKSGKYKLEVWDNSGK